MNRTDFMGILKDSGQIDRSRMGEIRELIDLFPWFQSAHLLLLKGLHNTEDVKFETQLKSSAIYLADREVLYYLLQKKSTIPGEAFLSQEETVQVQEEIPDNQQVVIETGRSSEDIIHNLETPSIIAGEEKGSDYLPGHPVIEEVITLTESETDESASIILTIDDGEVHIEETVFYMDPAISAPEPGELLELDEATIDIRGNGTADNVQEKIPEKTVSKKQKQTELIDKFILSNPRIEPSKDKTLKPQEDLSVPYVEQKSGFVTETLAKIFVSQGYYSRAIEIYEKLSLKYPEKSSYFASQIEKINRLIK